MRNLRKNIVGLCLVGMGLGLGAAAQAATGVGPYYAMPAWDQTLPAATRFIVLTNMNSQAVLDRETGLVWEQSPDASIDSWVGAQIHCNQKNLGGRKGWRLPGIQELASLLDPSLRSPALPPGHPFANVRSGANNFEQTYWSADAVVGLPFFAWVVRFGSGNVDRQEKAGETGAFVWCVRGGQGSAAH